MKTGAKDGGGRTPSAAARENGYGNPFPLSKNIQHCSRWFRWWLPYLHCLRREGQTCLYTMSCDQSCFPPTTVVAAPELPRPSYLAVDLARRRSYLTVVIFTFPGRVPIFLGIKAKRRCLKLVAALMRAAVQEPRHQLLVHPLSMRTTRWIHKWRTGVPKILCSSKAGSERSQAASSGRRDGISHVSRESQLARTNAWTPPHNAGASSMHGNPRNTSCALDRASRVPECCGSPFI